MQHNITYKLPEESDELKLAMNGPKFAIILEEIDNYLRKLWKYEDKDVVNIEELRKFITDLHIEYEVPRE